MSPSKWHSFLQMKSIPFSALLPSSWPFPEGEGALLVQPRLLLQKPWGEREWASLSHPGSQEDTQACSALGSLCHLPNWVVIFGWVETAPQTWREGGRLGSGGRTGPGSFILQRLLAEKDTCHVHLAWAGSASSGARSPRSPRSPVGGALVMHYSSPSRPPAGAAAASLAFPARAAGCAAERERGAFTILWQLRE